MQTKDKGIISLVVILSVGFLAVSAALTVALSSFSGLIDNRNTKFGDFAFYTSEAAAKEGVLQIIADTDYSGSSFELLNDSSQADISVDELEWPYVEIAGVSDNRFSSRDNVLTVTLFAEGLAFNYAIYSQTDLNFGGNVEVNGNVFANDGFSFNGNSANINGDAFSAGSIDDTDNIQGDVYENVEPLSPPIIDIEEYRPLADIVFDNSSDAKNYIANQTVNAVVFIDDLGETKIQGNNTNFTGCLAIKGDLDLTGGVFTTIDDYPAIIVEGDLKIAGGAEINGVVYVTGNTSFGAGGGSINGSLISVGDVTTTEITGNVTINYVSEYADMWQNMPGLETESGTIRIVGWRQE